MLSDTLLMDPTDLYAGTGWEVKPQGACRGERCVPLPEAARVDGRVDLRVFAERLGMPLVHDETHRLWALGPEAGGRALASAAAPDLVLPTLDGEPFPLQALRGRKVLIAAWASW